MAKFKVGDKVEILDGSGIENYTGCFTFPMRRHIGETMEIRSIVKFDDGRIGYKMNEMCYTWDERGLKLAADHNEKIVVTTDGVTTTAKMYHGKTVVKTATAKCNPDDKFDFDKGAKIAVDRLLGVDVVSDDKDDGFKVGDIVTITDNGEIYATYTKWIVENVKDVEKVARFRYNENPRTNFTKYRIVAIGKHNGIFEHNRHNVIAYIEDVHTEECYLIGVKGLKKC